MGTRLPGSKIIKRRKKLPVPESWASIRKRLANKHKLPQKFNGFTELNEE